jgi:signal transduction histidine kinase
MSDKVLEQLAQTDYTSMTSSHHEVFLLPLELEGFLQPARLKCFQQLLSADVDECSLYVLYFAVVGLDYVIDKSYRDLEIRWVMLDPSRMLQILINLITNAIRFTKNESTRTITVTLAASSTKPANSLAGIPYLTQPNARPNVPEKTEETKAAEEGKGEEDKEEGGSGVEEKGEKGKRKGAQNDEKTVYLLITVADTGCGMKPDELERIFLRFQQSSHKTHIEYGGSGLGLFISRELARLQGGQIGVHSQHGVGSTFEFYIKAMRCERPPEQAVKGTEPDLAHQHQHQRPRQGKGPSTPQAERATHILLVEDNVRMSRAT